MGYTFNNIRWWIFNFHIHNCFEKQASGASFKTWHQNETQHAIVSIAILGDPKYMFIACCELVHLIRHYGKCCANKTRCKKMLELASGWAIKPRSDRKGNCCLSVEGISWDDDDDDDVASADKLVVRANNRNSHYCKHRRVSTLYLNWIP